MVKPGQKFTRNDRGGSYEFLGVACGAGTSKHAPRVMVYRDLKTGALLFREPENFAYRMKQVSTVGGVA